MMRKYCFLVLSLFILSACGGSGGGTSSLPTTDEVSNPSASSQIRKDISPLDYVFVYNENFSNGIGSDSNSGPLSAKANFDFSFPSFENPTPPFNDLPNEGNVELLPGLSDPTSSSPFGTLQQGLEFTGSANRLDAAVDENRGNILVVFERNEGGNQGLTAIYGRFYNANGDRVGDDVLITDVNAQEHHVEPNFNQIAAFANVTEPTCNSFLNPKVVFIRGETVEEDTYFIVYETKCSATVRFPSEAQFFNNVAPDAPVFDLNDTLEREQSFTIIQGLRVSAINLDRLPENQVGPFSTPRLLSQLYASFLYNEDAENNEPEKSDRSLWKWSDAKNPSISVNENGNVFVSYQTSRKFISCMNNQVSLGVETQARYFDGLYSLDGKMLYDEGRGRGLSIFRSAYVAKDGEEREFQRGRCASLAIAGNLESAYNPAVSTNFNSSFQVLFSVESAKIDEHKNNVVTKKIVGTKQLLLDASRDDELIPLQDDENTAVDFSLVLQNPNFANAFVNAGEFKHSNPALSYDENRNLFVAAYDDGSGVSVFLMRENGTFIDSDRQSEVVKGVNWSAPIAPNAFYPSLSQAKVLAEGGTSVSKLGLAVQQMNQDGSWNISQNFVRLFLNDDGVLEFSFERDRDEDFDLSAKAETELGSNLDQSYFPVSLSLPTGNDEHRYRTFWIATPPHQDGVDTIYSTFVPEGVAPEARFKVMFGQTVFDSRNGDFVLRAHNLEENPLTLHFDGTTSVDPDSEQNAANRGIASWAWQIDSVNVNPEYNFVPGDADAEGLGRFSTESNPLTEYGEYRVILKVRDHDGFIGRKELLFTVEENAAPKIESVQVFVGRGAIEGITLPEDSEELAPLRTNSHLEFMFNATDQDEDEADRTPPAQITYTWEVRRDNNIINDGIEIVGNANNRITFPVAQAGLYSLSLQAYDQEGTASIPFTRSFTISPLEITAFTAQENSIDLFSPSLDDEPYGKARLTWNTSLADSVQLFKRVWTNDQIGVEEPVTQEDLVQPGNPGDALVFPLNTETPFELKLQRKTNYILRAQGGDQSVEASTLITFNAPQITSLTSDAAANRVRLVPGQSYAQALLTWNTQNASQIVSLTGELGNGQVVAFDYRDPNNPEVTAPVFPAVSSNQIGSTLVRVTENTRFTLTAVNPDGVRVTRQIQLSFDAPVIEAWSADEESALPESEVHVNWQTQNATSLRVVLIRNGNEEERLAINNDAARIALAQHVGVLIPDFAQNAQASLRLDVTGPGGSVSSALIPLELLAVNLRINSFTSNVPQGEGIDLLPASVSGNPSPDAVYGEVFLKWQTSEAQFVRLLKRSWQVDAGSGLTVAGQNEELVPADELPDQNGQSQEHQPLPLTFEAGAQGVRVRVKRDTTYVIEARATVQGVEHTIRSNVEIHFNSAAINAFTATQNVIPYNNGTRDGTGQLNWSTHNIKSVRLIAYPWNDFETQPIVDVAPHTELVAPQNFFALVNGTHAHAFNRKQTFVMLATDVLDRELRRTVDIEFALPSISRFEALPNPVNFAAGTTSANAQLLWETANSSSVQLSADSENVQLVNPAPDSSGIGGESVTISRATRYELVVSNPDGRTVSQELVLQFNAVTLDLDGLPDTLGESRIYHGRPARITWRSPQNISQMNVFLADVNGQALAGGPSQQFATPQAVALGVWNFTLPESDEEQVRYKVCASIPNPNLDPAEVVICSQNFSAFRRPVPHITSFTLSPQQIVDIEDNGGQLIGRSTLAWNAFTDNAQPSVLALEEQRGGVGAFAAIAGVNTNSLNAQGSVQVTIGVNDVPTFYKITVQNRFDDSVSSGEEGLFGNQEPDNARLEFATPSVTQFSVSEQVAYPGRALTLTWQTRTATSLDVVMILNGNEEILETINLFADVLQSAARSIVLPQFAGEGNGQLRLDLRGPGGVVSSENFNIAFAQIPTSGVFRFCVPVDGGECSEAPQVNFDNGSFAANVNFNWIVDPAAINRVVRICVGDAPDNNGRCDGRNIELPAGANFVDQGNGNGVGSTIMSVEVNNSYWLVTQTTQGVEVAYATPLQVSFNAPQISSFVSARSVINQKLHNQINWTGLSNATSMNIEVLEGNSVFYVDEQNQLTHNFPFAAEEDLNVLPQGSLTSVVEDGVGALSFRITATGPGGEVTRNLSITVNDIPDDFLITSPNVDLELYTPTRLFVEWNGVEAANVDQDGISQYAICYQVYHTDANGGVVGENLPLENVGAPCPDITTQAFANLAMLPQGTILVPASGAETYQYVLEMDPKLNGAGEYLRYEIGVMAIDNDQQILGINLSKRAIVTDDSVLAWFKFDEDFTQGIDCPGAPAGYTICDASRYGRHARGNNGVEWENGSAILNRNEEGNQWIETNIPLPEFTEISMEVLSTPYAVNDRPFVNIGPAGDGTPFGDWYILFVARPSLRILSHEGVNNTSGSTVGENLQASPADPYHLMMTAQAGGNGDIYINGVLSNSAASLQSLIFPENRRYLLIGKTGAPVPLFSGEMNDVVIYERVLAEHERENNFRAAQ